MFMIIKEETNKAKCSQVEKQGDLFPDQVRCSVRLNRVLLSPSTDPLRLCCTRVANRRPYSRAGTDRTQTERVMLTGFFLPLPSSGPWQQVKSRRQNAKEVAGVTSAGEKVASWRQGLRTRVGLGKGEQQNQSPTLGGSSVHQVRRNGTGG